MFGGNKKKSGASIQKAQAGKKKGIGSSAKKSGGFGGHFRAVQGFKYIKRPIDE